MTRVFITGICGFLGSHLADALLADGHTVEGNDNLICGDMDNLPAGIPFQGIDCCDFDGMKKTLDRFKPDVLVHCAATAHEGVSNFSPSFITRNIYEASVATFSAAIASGVKRIVFMSSMARYGAGAEFIHVDKVGIKPPPFTEDFHTPAPVDPYGAAKCAAEITLRILCKTHGVNYSILVPHNIIGIRQKYDDPMRNVASIMINRLLKGLPPIVYGDGKQVRCFSPVKDCIPSIIKAVEGHADGEVINIGPDSGEISVLALAHKLIALTGASGEITFMPDRPNEVKEAYCSSDKVRQLLGYEPKQSLDDCLKDMVEYIRAKGTKDFDYSFPLEIVTDKTPKTWVERLI